MLPARAATRGSWHKKAKWMLKKVLIKTPTTSTQMRDLCSNIIERKHGSDSKSTAVVHTALQLWDDKNLVAALQNNATFLTAKERIQTLSSHILASSKGVPRTLGATQHVISSTLQEAVKCPSCGCNVHCAHDSSAKTPGPSSKISELSSEDATSDLLNTDDNFPLYSSFRQSIEEETETFKEYSLKSSTGTAGVVPAEFQDYETFQPGSSTSGPHVHDFMDNFNVWFGPLVLASFAVVGLAVGVFNGEITMPNRFKSLSVRVMTAVTMMVQASNSLLSILNE